MSSPNALFLLADHIKLSLLERKRAQALNLESDSQDGHISRSLEQFRDGLEALQAERARLEEAGEETKAAPLSDALPGLQKQLGDLTSQFHGFSSPSTTSTLTHPNDPSLAADFAHASSTTSISRATHPPTKKPGSLRTATTPGGGGAGPHKTVRFQDDAAASNSHSSSSSSSRSSSSSSRSSSSRSSTALADEQAAAALFNQPYRDDPDAPAGYRDAAAGLDNAQVHAHHRAVLAAQDAQLDALGASISRQRELSMQIGNELDGQVALLEDQEALVDRHQGRLDRARGALGKAARTAGESRQMVVIVALIVILVLLIAVLK